MHVLLCFMLLAIECTTCCSIILGYESKSGRVISSQSVFNEFDFFSRFFSHKNSKCHCNTWCFGKKFRNNEILKWLSSISIITRKNKNVLSVMAKVYRKLQWLPLFKFSIYFSLFAHSSRNVRSFVSSFYRSRYLLRANKNP